MHVTNKREHIPLIVLFLACEFLFVLPNLFFTYYVLESDQLYIKSGYFLIKYIKYSDIVKIREAKSLFSPCGLHNDRLEILYKYQDSLDTVKISPKNKKEMLQLLYERVKKYGSNNRLKNVYQYQEDNQPMNGIIELEKNH